jgi:hypothetical protein
MRKNEYSARTAFHVLPRNIPKPASPHVAQGPERTCSIFSASPVQPPSWSCGDLRNLPLMHHTQYNRPSRQLVEEAPIN